MKRFDIRNVQWATVLAAVVVFTAAAKADPPMLAISGGGTATFDDFEGGTIFSVQAQVDVADNVEGHFFCAIPGIVVINGDDLTEAVVNADGSVELYGLAHGWDVAVGVFKDMPFAVQLWPGGAEIGRFIYDDPVVGPSGGVDLAEGDRETVASGHIMFGVK